MAFGCFIISGCHSSGVFKFVEAAFDAISQSIDVAVAGCLDFAVALHGDNGDTATFLHILPDKISVIPFIT